MKVKIGGIEISDVSLEELDELVRRYGLTQTGESAQPQQSQQRSVGQGSGAADDVVLKKFVEAGWTGVPTTTLGEILGKRGRGTRKAAHAWAKRIGLTNDPALSPFEDCRSGTKRGIRLKASFHDVAKHLSQQR